MWVTTADDAPMEGWTLSELDTESSVIARRVFVGTVITVALALIVSVGWFVAGRGDTSISATVGRIDATSDELSAQLDGLDPVIQDLSDGQLDDREGAASHAAAIDSSGRKLFVHGAELPPIEDWAALRSSTVSISDRSIAVARSVSRTTSYIATINVMLNRPAYPLEVDDAEIGPTAEMTATWVTRFLSTSSSLPSVPDLAEHHEQVVALAGDLPEWQGRYLDALRANDIGAAGAAVAELEAAVADLVVSMSGALTNIASTLDNDRSAIIRDLSR